MANWPRRAFPSALETLAGASLLICSTNGRAGSSKLLFFSTMVEKFRPPSNWFSSSTLLPGEFVSANRSGGAGSRIIARIAQHRVRIERARVKFRERGKLNSIECTVTAMWQCSRSADRCKRIRLHQSAVNADAWEAVAAQLQLPNTWIMSALKY